MKENNNTKVVLVNFRSNPQLGDFCTIKLAEIKKATKATIFVNYLGEDLKFDAFGNQKTSTALLTFASSL